MAAGGAKTRRMRDVRKHCRRLDRALWSPVLHNSVVRGRRARVVFFCSIGNRPDPSAVLSMTFAVRPTSAFRYFGRPLFRGPLAVGGRGAKNERNRQIPQTVLPPPVGGQTDVRGFSGGKTRLEKRSQVVRARIRAKPSPSPFLKARK